MLLRLFLLSVFALQVAPHEMDLVAGVVSPANSRSAPLRALDDAPSTNFESPTLARKLRSGVSQLFGGYLNPNPHEKYFTDVKRAQVLENWKDNQAGLSSLYQDSKKLKKLKFKMKEKLNYWAPMNSMVSSQTYKKLVSAHKALNQFEERIAHFKTFRLLELGGIHLPKSRLQLMALLRSKDPQLHSGLMRLPPGVLEMTIRKTWTSLGDSLVNDLRVLALTGQLFFHHDSSEYPAVAFQEDLLEWWKRVFRTIDLLYNNNFVSQDAVRNFFLGPEMKQHLLRYIELRFQYDIHATILRGASDFSEHWYWPLLHKSFEALTKHDIKVLQAHLLLGVRYQEIKKWIEKSPQVKEGWQEFFLKFDNVKYLRASGMLDASKDPTAYSPNKQISQKLNPQALQNSIKSDVKQIIKLISTVEAEFLLISRPVEIFWVKYLVDILDFIERDIFPEGFIQKILQKHPNRIEFDHRINLIRLSAKGKDIAFETTKHLDYLRIQKTKNNRVPDSSILEFKELYLTQINDLIYQYQLEFERLQSKLNTTSSPFHAIILEDFEFLQTLFNKFQKKIHHLLSS